MKKSLIALMAAVLVSAVSLQAKVVASRSFKAKQSKTEWILRAGVTFNDCAIDSKMSKELSKIEKRGYDYSWPAQTGANLSIAFNRAIGKSGLYWGMELGFDTRGYGLKGQVKNEENPDNGYWEKQTLLAWDAKYSPFTLGYKYKLNDDMRIDAHLGAFASYSFYDTGTISEGYEKEDHREDAPELMDSPFDAGIQAGIGFFYKKINIDITYQRGFFDMGRFDWYDSDGYHQRSSCKSSNVMLRIGFAF